MLLICTILYTVKQKSCLSLPFPGACTHTHMHTHTHILFSVTQGINSAFNKTKKFVTTLLTCWEMLLNRFQFTWVKWYWTNLKEHFEGFRPEWCISSMIYSRDTPFWARMHHKVVGNFKSEADVRSLYYRHFRFNDTSDVGACTHGRPSK